MPGNFATTTRNSLRRLLGTSKVSDVDEGFQALAEDVDTKMASYWSGLFSARPAAGQPNRFYRATDTGALYHDTGTVWEHVFTLSAASVYGAPVARSKATLYEASASQAALVTLTFRVGDGAAGESGATVFVGGVEIFTGRSQQSTGIGYTNVTFLLPPGKTWQATSLNGGGGNMTSNYLLLGGL